MGKFMRDYDKEPIIVKNDYLLKSELAIRIFFLILASIFAIRCIFPIESLFNNALRKSELALCICVFFGSIFKDLAMVRGMLANDLQIRIFNKRIECDYVDFAGNCKILEFGVDEKTKITYSYMPRFGEKISNKSNMKISEKIADTLVYIPAMLINMSFVLIFQILKLFKIERYYILDNGSMTISIRRNQEIIDKFGDVAFDKESLTLSLINHSSKIFNT
jgi:hypothetical protein